MFRGGAASAYPGSAVESTPHMSRLIHRSHSIPSAAPEFVSGMLDGAARSWGLPVWGKGDGVVPPSRDFSSAAMLLASCLSRVFFASVVLSSEGSLRKGVGLATTRLDTRLGAKGGVGCLRGFLMGRRVLG